MDRRLPNCIFGHWLSYKLTECGMTELDLSKALGITRVTISNHIRGKTIPHISVLEIYANYFGVPWLFLYEMFLEDSK